MRTAPPRVLIVDDDPAICDSLALLVETSGFEAATLTTLEAATSRLDDPRLTAVLLDGGLVTPSWLRRLRQRLPHIGVLLYSGRPLQDALASIADADPNCRFLAKPSDALLVPQVLDQLSAQAVAAELPA